jgi:hypothetical protein
MQFKSKTLEQRGALTAAPSYLVNSHTPEHLVGRLCQLVEMMGLRETQEKATKDTLKQIIYDAFSYENGCRTLDGELCYVIWDVIHKEEQYARENHQPSGMVGEYELIKTIKD